MKRPELRGSHSIEKAKLNKESVKNWMKLNPTGTQRKCQNDLSLSHVTVRKYMVEIENEAIEKAGN